MPTSASTRLGLIGPDGGDVVIHGDDVIRGIIAQLEAVGARFRVAAVASRGSAAASNLGEVFIANDTGIVSVSTGAAWLDLQPLDGDLTAIAALSTTSFGRALLALADGPAARSAIGVLPFSPEATVASLPGSPVDGQECYYLADSSNGVVWHLKYRSATSAWHCVGGPPISRFASGTVTQNLSGGAGNETAPDSALSLNVPLAGDYEIDLDMSITVNAIVTLVIGPFVAGVGDYTDTIDVSIPASGYWVPASGARKALGVAANALIEQRWYHTGGSALNLSRKGASMRVRPIKVTG